MQNDRPTPPVFMFGMDRSGTTLLSMMVGAHPDVAVPLTTTGMWYEVATNLPGDFDTPAGTSRVVREIMGHDRIRLWDRALDEKRIATSVTPGEFASIVAAFHAEYALQSGKTRWASMDIATLDNMHVANAWFPDARFVHIVRDGRDVALSHQGYRYGAGNIAEVAAKWEARVIRNLRMGAMLPKSRYFVIRYEDLVLEPERTLRELCSFIGLPFSASMLQYRDEVDRKIPADKRFLWPSLKNPPMATKVARWKREMSQSQRIIFEQRAGPLLRELSYETFEEPRQSAGAALLETWYAMDQGGRFKRLARKLGISNR